MRRFIMAGRSIVLIDPLFEREHNLPIGFSGRALLLGPIMPFKNGDYWFGCIHLLLSILSVGLYWVYYSFIHYRSEIRLRLEKGWKPAGTKDLELLEELHFVLEGNPSNYIGISRTNSVDHTFGKENP